MLIIQSGKMDTDNLLTEIYKYFPRNCDPFSIEYTLAEETTHKRYAITQRKNSIESQWTHFIAVLRNEADAPGIADHSDAYTDIFCNYAAYEKKISGTILRFHVILSLLAPYHAVIVSAFTGQDQGHVITGDYEEIENQLAQEIVQSRIVKKETEMLDSKLIQTFGTKRLYKKNIEKIIVPEIATQEKRAGEASLFDCLFTSQLLTY